MSDSLPGYDAWKLAGPPEDEDDDWDGWPEDEDDDWDDEEEDA